MAGVLSGVFLILGSGSITLGDGTNTSSPSLHDLLVEDVVTKKYQTIKRTIVLPFVRECISRAIKAATRIVVYSI